MIDNTGYEKTVLAVTFDVTANEYKIGTCQGSSVAEMAFAVMAVIRALERDGHIKDKAEFMKLIDKYYSDPQFEEVKE